MEGLGSVLRVIQNTACRAVAAALRDTRLEDVVARVVRLVIAHEPQGLKMTHLKEHYLAE